MLGWGWDPRGKYRRKSGVRGTWTEVGKSGGVKFRRSRKTEGVLGGKGGVIVREGRSDVSVLDGPVDGGRERDE